MLKVTGSYGIVQSFVTGSLAYNISESVVTKTDSYVGSNASQSIYSYADDVGKVFVRNTNLWINSVDISCITTVVGNGPYYGGVLVAPDIVICANHVALSPGQIIGFVDKNNNFVSATVLTGSQITGSQTYMTSDVYVARLTSPITGTIVPATVMPYAEFISGSKITSQAINSYLLPVVYSTQYRFLGIGTMGPFSNDSLVVYAPQITSSLYPWYTAIVRGDSGSPYFFIVNNSVVALGTWYTSNFLNTSGGPSIAYYQNSVNTMIKSLGSSYHLTTCSLSSFPTYPTSSH
jgi:hypothetical protein